MGIGAMKAIAAGVSAITAIAGSAVAIRNANKKGKIAKRTLQEGNELEQKAWSDRKDYAVSPEVRAQYDRSLNSLSAKSRIQSSMETQADTGVANIISATNKNATSQSAGLAGALAAEQQRQAGYQNAAVAGAQDNQNKMSQLAHATGMLNDSEDQAYNLNVQQKFDLNYGKSQDMIATGYQGKIDAMDQKAKAWADGFSAVSKAAGSLAGTKSGKNQPKPTT